MTKTFNMQFMRYMNIFSRVTGIVAKHCFSYNNTLVFVVPKNRIQDAIGRDNSNLKRLSGFMEKRIRVLAEPNGMADLKNFVTVLVSPIEFEKIEIHETPVSENSYATPAKEVVITTGGREAKAMLIGRERIREKELKEILEQYFEIKNVRIN